MVAECGLLGWALFEACIKNKTKREEFEKSWDLVKESLSQLRQSHENTVRRNQELTNSISTWETKYKSMEAKKKEMEEKVRKLEAKNKTLEEQCLVDLE